MSKRVLVAIFGNVNIVDAVKVGKRPDPGRESGRLKQQIVIREVRGEGKEAMGEKGNKEEKHSPNECVD